MINLFKVMDNRFINTVLLFAFISIVYSQSVNNEINSVVNVDLITAANAQRHMTSMFYRTANPPQILIVRRGGAFNIRIHLKSPFFNVNRLQLHFRFETKQGVYHVLIPSKQTVWKAQFSIKSNVIEAQITLPVDVPVGFWDLFIYTYHSNLRQYNSYVVKDILILFNPWSPMDTVYMQNAVDLSEYILNEFGYIVTIDKTMTRKPWIYGQFKPTIVEGLKIVLSKLSLSPQARANPVLFSRALSAIVNFQNDYGMMAGRWNGTYETNLFGYITRHPLLWLGSPEILEEYIKNKGYVVGYAQCWVFASLITTFGRALGIPARTITNFESGHDFDSNATIHFQFDQFNELVSEKSESIWNFHVWTEMWMKRFDLSYDGVTYGGWQILDGTPQQLSRDTVEKDGKHWYQLGPASRAAVKRADITLKYDTRFVYAEVNADVIYRNHLSEVINQDPARIGLGSYTKGPTNLIDATFAYKEKEKTVSERASFMKAIQQIYNLPNITPRAYKATVRDFKVQMTRNKKQLGSVIDFLVTVSNDFPRARHFDVSIDAYSLYYTGVKGHSIYNTRYQLNLGPYSENAKTILISPEQYIYKLVPFSIVRAEITIRTPGRSVFKQMFDLILEKPALVIKPIGKAVIRKPFYIDVNLINPLNVPLTKCVFSIHGLRVNGDLHSVQTVAPKTTRIYRFALVFNELITEMIAIQFSSAELDQVAGYIQVPVNAV